MSHITDTPGPPGPEFEGRPDVPTPGPDLPFALPRFLVATLGFFGGCLAVAAVYLTCGILLGTMIILVLFVFYGCMLYAFLNYRFSRQEELLHLLTTAVQARAPLAPALRAFLRDRPCPAPPRFLTALGMFFTVSTLAAVAALLADFPPLGILIALLLFALAEGLLFLFYRGFPRGFLSDGLAFVTLLVPLALLGLVSGIMFPALQISDFLLPVCFAWMGLLLLYLLPGYFLILYPRHGFDRKIARVARLLERGYGLDQALRATPGVVPREAILAAAIGQSTGELALCLRNSARSRFATLWVEALPRLLYPVGLLLFILGLIAFWMTFIAPKMQRIFKDFNEEMPWQTTILIAGWAALLSQDWAVVLVFMLVSGLIILGIASPTVRWNLPVVGWIYRRGIQGRLMKMLSVLLDAGKTVPQALEVLADSGYFPDVVNRRLDDARAQVEQGEQWVDSLRRVNLLPAAVVPMLQAAERVQNLPWALAEGGDALATHTFRLLYRLTLVFSPAVVCAIGLLVGFIVVGMFIPLADLLTKLSQ